MDALVDFCSEHVPALTRFFEQLPEGDLTLIKEDVSDPRVMDSWAEHAVGRRWLTLDGELVTGFLAVLPLPGWSDHVGEIRLVVHPDHRGRGLGRRLARHALIRSVEARRSKLIVEIVADQDAALAMFSALGFTGEALLRDHIRDHDGRLHDLVVLAHYVDDTWSRMGSVGIADELGGR
jgi:ribosomal protein S18 acetylase RimI-like enzyme